MSGKKSVACIAYLNEKVLIARRSPKGQMGGRWEFPGGKVEDGETDAQSVVREMQEEFGIKVQCGDFICSSVFVHNESEVTLNAYFITVPHDGISQEYKLSEHTEYRWVNVEEIPSLSFVDSDMKIFPCVKKVLEEIKGAVK